MSTPTNNPPAEPATLVDWLWYVKRYEKGIYVREQLPDGRWGSVALADLPPDRWAYHVERWLADGHIPVRVKEEGEQMSTITLTDGTIVDVTKARSDAEAWRQAVLSGRTTLSYKEFVAALPRGDYRERGNHEPAN